MKMPSSLLALSLGASFVGADAPTRARTDESKQAATITWKKTVVDKLFRSEGVGVGDFNKDGKMDIFVGDCWYEAPDWKRHVIRSDKPFDPRNYSESFGCFADDFDGDGWVDVIVAPFPGKECFWYQNPGKDGGKWRERLVTTSACNETPIYVDLFKTGKKVLVMGWQPANKEEFGEMCYFTPGPDATKPWRKHSISGPSTQGKEVPGTRRFSHGLGHGDINGDGRLDVIIPQGWWEQPEKTDSSPWKFHAANLGEACADMYTLDIDGDGKNDVVSTSAHSFGLWWHQHKVVEGASPKFSRLDLAIGESLVKDPKNWKLTADEKKYIDAVNQLRANKGLAALKPSPLLGKLAREHADQAAANGDFGPQIPRPSQLAPKLGHPGKIIELNRHTDKEFFWSNFPEPNHEDRFLEAYREIGVGVAHRKARSFGVIVMGNEPSACRGNIVVWDGMVKNPVSQTHALHYVDIDGDGLKDLVSGRRFWAHGPKGDPGSAEPAFLFWLKAHKDDKGRTTFTPHLIDDDSGIGTQFIVVDINGDGIPDVVVSNKKGVFVFEQVRGGTLSAPPVRKD